MCLIPLIFKKKIDQLRSRDCVEQIVNWKQPDYFVIVSLHCCLKKNPESVQSEDKTRTSNRLRSISNVTT